ncbi:MAG: hypothetical protein GF347_00345 [Candidatus Moranbacteria bacterium]|nr:hypothetical protein [Candidatus Moranbacteria bacterium]
MTSKYFFEIIPITNLPYHSKQAFTYSSNQKLTSGDLVKIKFQRKTIFGIVLNHLKPKTTTYQVKPVESLIIKNYLSKNQLEFLKKIAEYYYASLSTLIKNHLTNFPNFYAKNQAPKKNLTKNLKGNFQIHKKDLQIVKQILKQAKTQKEILLFYPDRLKIYLYLVLKYLKQNQKILLITPNFELSFAHLLFFQKYLDKNLIALIDKNQGKKNLGLVYNQIHTSESLLIIANRSAIINNFQNLGLIIIEEAQSQSLKLWNQKPYYHVNQIAHLYASIFPCLVIYGSNSPSLSLNLDSKIN